MGYLTFFQPGTQRPCLGWGCREMQLLLSNYVPARGCWGSSQAQWNREIISFLAEPKPVSALVKVEQTCPCSNSYRSEIGKKLSIVTFSEFTEI